MLFLGHPIKPRKDVSPSIRQLAKPTALAIGGRWRRVLPEVVCHPPVAQQLLEAGLRVIVVPTIAHTGKIRRGFGRLGSDAGSSIHEQVTLVHHHCLHCRVRYPCQIVGVDNQVIVRAHGQRLPKPQ